ncbi:MAG: DinB family protein, partial [bacterium]
KKEILGHMVDSASNNHQRFVRAQQVSEFRFPVYKQTDWVRSQNYQAENWIDILNLWIALNQHLAYIINQIPAEKLKVVCWIGENQPITLAELIEDYIQHQEHHLKQIDSEF